MRQRRVLLVFDLCDVLIIRLLCFPMRVTIGLLKTYQTEAWKSRKLSYHLHLATLGLKVISSAKVWALGVDAMCQHQAVINESLSLASSV